MESDKSEKPEAVFAGCDRTHVYNLVRRKLDSEPGRSLWRRIESEMSTGGLGGVDTYLQSRFVEIIQQLRVSIVRFQEKTEGEQ